MWVVVGGAAQQRCPHRQAAGPGNTSGGESVRWWIGSDLLGYLFVLHEKGIQRFGGHEDEGSLGGPFHGG